MELHFNNPYNLGDCIFSIIYFNKLIKHDNSYRIIFHCNPDYHGQLKEISDNNNISLWPYCDIGESTWIGRDCLYHGTNGEYSGRYGQTTNFDEIYIHFYNYLSEKIKVDLKFNKAEDILYDSEQFLVDIDKYDLGYDLLVVNSTPLSRQFPHSVTEFDNIVQELSATRNVVTTKKVEGIDCTMDNDFTVLDIAKLSYYTPDIIAIHTAPHILALNKFTINKFKRWAIFDLHHSYSYNFMNHYTTLSGFQEDKFKW